MSLEILKHLSGSYTDPKAGMRGEDPKKEMAGRFGIAISQQYGPLLIDLKHQLAIQINPDNQSAEKVFDISTDGKIEGDGKNPPPLHDLHIEIKDAIKNTLSEIG